MDAGVPIKAPVAGIGVGIIVNDDFSKFKILTDLAYKEDAYGFLDFKMTGTREGVTAIQSDMKLAGIPTDIMPEIIKHSETGFIASDYEHFKAFINSIDSIKYKDCRKDVEERFSRQMMAKRFEKILIELKEGKEW